MIMQLVNDNEYVSSHNFVSFNLFCCLLHLVTMISMGPAMGPATSSRNCHCYVKRQAGWAPTFLSNKLRLLSPTSSAFCLQQAPPFVSNKLRLLSPTSSDVRFRSSNDDVNGTCHFFPKLPLLREATSWMSANIPFQQAPIFVSNKLRRSFPIQGSFPIWLSFPTPFEDITGIFRHCYLLP
jgi:hypothetical protein